MGQFSCERLKVKFQMKLTLDSCSVFQEPDFIDDDTTPKIKVKAEYLKSQFTRDEDQRRTRLFTGLQTVKTSPKFASAVELVPHSDSSSDDADSVTMAKELQNSTLIPTGSRPRSRTAFELGYSSDNKYDRVSIVIVFLYGEVALTWF